MALATEGNVLLQADWSSVGIDEAMRGLFTAGHGATTGCCLEEGFKICATIDEERKAITAAILIQLET